MSKDPEKSLGDISENPMDLPADDGAKMPQMPTAMADNRELAKLLGENRESGADLKSEMLGSVNRSQGFIERNLIGSGSVPKEISGIGGAYSDFYIGPVKSGLTVMKNIVQLNPKGVANEVKSGVLNSLGSIIKIPTSSVKLASASISSIGRAGKAVLKAPVNAVEGIAKSPMWLWGKVEDWTNRLSHVSKRLTTAHA